MYVPRLRQDSGWQCCSCFSAEPFLYITFVVGPVIVILAFLVVAISLFMLSLLVPFLSLLGPQVSHIAAQRSQRWNISAPGGLDSFDYGSYPDTDGDFFRNVHVANVHSHNDYWRDVPLLTSLSYGCASTEADVWLINGTLLVGHDLASLRPERNFSSLYIEPLVKILDQKNPSTQYTAYAQEKFGYSENNGIYDTDSGISLNLLVDVKTPGSETWPYVVEALQPLRDRGYLSFVTVNATAMNSRAITVIGTGDTPLDYFLSRPDRDYFFDAPLASLNATFIPTLSPLASTSLKAQIGWTGVFTASKAQNDSMTKLISQAHEQGLKVRFWENPTWPLFARNRVWNTFIELGVDYINADDLEAATAL